MPSTEPTSPTAPRRGADTVISALIILYGLAVLALVWINPQSRLYPIRALQSIASGFEGEWHFPWQHFHALAIFALTLLTAESLGGLARIHEWYLRILAGYGLLGLLMFCLGAIGLYRAPVFWGFVAVVIAIRWGLHAITSIRPPTAREGVRSFTRDHSIHKIASALNDSKSDKASRSTQTAKWDWIVYACFLLFIIGYALTPPIQSDGIRYHLAALQEYLKAGELIYLPFNAFTNMPFLVEMIFLLPLGLGSDVAAQLVHLSFLVISAEIVYRMLAEHVDGFRPTHSIPSTALIVRLMFLSFPVAVIVSAWPFVDTALLAFFLAMLFMLFRWFSDPRESRHLLWCGFFAGACLATKYTMVVFVGLIVAIVLLFYYQSFRNQRTFLSLKPLIFFLAIIVAVASPWYVRNIITTGNPVYPLANGIFQGGEWGEVSAQLYSTKAGAKGSKSLAGFVAGPLLSTISWTPIPAAQDAPRPWYVRLNYEDQFPGPAFLIMLPFILIAAIALLTRDRRRLKRWYYPPYLIIGISIIFYVFWFFTYQSNRFLLPLYALTILGIVFAIDMFSLRRWRNTLILILCITFVYGYIWSLEWMYARTRVSPLPYLLGVQSRGDYIHETLPHTEGFKALAALADPDAKTLFVGEYRGYYCAVPYIANDFFDQPVILDYLRRANLDLDQLRQVLLDDSIRYIYLNMAELQLYLSDFRRFFTPGEWDAFQRFLDAPWLEPIWESPPGFHIYEITNN